MCFQQILATPHPDWNQYLSKLHPRPLMFRFKLPRMGPRMDCADIYREGFHTSGVYQIYPSGPFIPLNVYCDMATDGGGWTVLQRRNNGSVDFYRGWDDYKRGFGTADGEYWLGLENIHSLTARRQYELRIDLEDFENKTVYAKYRLFALSPNAINAEENGYRLQVMHFIDGGAGDSLAYHNGLKFSTFDRNHQAPLNCAEKCSGAFWYKSCHTANINGLYLKGAHSSYANGIHWATWTGYYYSLKATAMKMRPISLPFPV
ncbi:microfibril-associated glycoprotein 4 isoform X1 [Rhincodon typus]|uniref:microfibril-associated glycoprotein 4 isoform X1 n=2 Tax=Rhincodon typus TaxID=259920 RepID=UPI0020302BDC|nr:microfibril-associated glycoprotein 4 isoform X1 [Rhincodon typus]